VVADRAPIPPGATMARDDAKPAGKDQRSVYTQCCLPREDTTDPAASMPRTFTIHTRPL
jgi:hypothetical protein